MAIGQSRPTQQEKKLLLQYKKYAKIEDIPEFVPNETLRKMRTFRRMKVATALTVGCLFGSLLYAKRAEYLLKLQEPRKKNAQSG